MTELEINNVLPLIKAMAFRFIDTQERMPPSIDFDDLVQEALLQAIICRHRYINNGRATFNTYMVKVAKCKWIDMINKSKVGPSAQYAYYLRKNNKTAGVSIEIPLSGNVSNPNVEHVETLKLSNPIISKGIWFNKSRNKWHVQPTVNGIRCFIGQYDNADDAEFAFSEFKDRITG